jgi:hypothetical protein
MAEPTSFEITWRDGAYYVSVPNYKGGTVYTAAEHDRLTRENEVLRKALDVARRYVDAVVVNTPDKKKRRNYSDCLRIIDDAVALKESGQ